GRAQAQDGAQRTVQIERAIRLLRLDLARYLPIYGSRHGGGSFIAGSCIITTNDSAGFSSFQHAPSHERRPVLSVPPLLRQLQSEIESIIAPGCISSESTARVPLKVEHLSARAMPRHNGCRGTAAGPAAGGGPDR